jgi:micrococcal nuclease
VRFNEKWVGLLIIAVALVRLGMLAYEKPSVQSKASEISAVQPSERTACQVLTVYDGDTLGCDLNKNGHIEKPQEEVRLLGIDTPEMHYSKKNHTYGTVHSVDEPFAKEASQWLGKSALHRTVFLEFDERKQDKYHRVLAFVYPSAQAGVSFNERLLRLGYAKLLFLGKNRLHESEFQIAEHDARLSHRALWNVTR